MNLDEVRSKLEVLEGNREQLERLRSLSETEFASDALYLDSALHRLQTSIQALLDIAAYVLGSLGRPAPRSSADLVRALVDGGFVGAEEREAYLRMVAFRNRVVHLYNRIDPAQVHRILQDHLGDLERLGARLIAIIAANPDPARPS